MSFTYPFFLTAFIIFIPLFIFDIYRRKQRVHGELPASLKKRMFISALFFRLFLASAIIALAVPQWGIKVIKTEYRRRLDIVYAIDLSRSMDIRDVDNDEKESRLERGLSIAAGSIPLIAGARFAAVIGRSSAYSAFPLTWDTDTALSFLESINGSSMSGRSTNLEALIDTAANVLNDAFPAQKVIVLISDGESLSGTVKNAVEKCAKNGIIIYSVATGSDDGRPVPDNDDIISRRDAVMMRFAADRTGGVYIDANNSNAHLVLGTNLRRLSQDSAASGGREEPKERRLFFIILAILFFGLSKFSPLIRPHTAMVILCVIINPCLQSCSQGKLFLIQANYLNSHGRYNDAMNAYSKAMNYKETAPYAEYGTGLTFYNLDENEMALAQYDKSKKLLESFSAAEHRELRYRVNYNSGIIHFVEGNYQAAASAFREALKEDHRRVEAKRNLELSLLSMARERASDRPTERQSDEAREALFDYIKQMEQQQWLSKEWSEEEKSMFPDY
jgi:Ca-activated chloride channel family protein